MGGLYSPWPARAAAGVLLLHGFPGVLKNEDIAAELCRRGLIVFSPHFRGCWGSPGEYSVAGLFEDARAALRLLARYPRVDPRRLGVLGYSVGGWVALRLASEVPVAAAVVMAPALPRADGAGDARYLRKNARVLSIPRVEALWREYLRAAADDHPEVYLRRIAPAPLLFVQGSRDRLVPPAATTRLWSLAGEPKELLRFQNEEHEFQNDRRRVVAEVSGWLAARLSEGKSSACEGRHGASVPAVLV